MASTGENRKPVIILVMCAVAAVLVMALGVGIGQGDRAGDGGWQHRLEGLGLASHLRVTDLRLTGGNCVPTGSVVVVTGTCSFEVSAAGGPFPMLGATRRALLTSGPAPVRVSVMMEGHEIEGTLDPSGTIRITFGPSGGTLSLACGAAGAGQCSASLSEDNR